MGTIDDFVHILADAKQGDDRAVAVIFDAYQPVLLRYLRWQEPDAADDLAGETWLAVAQGIGAFEGDEASLRAWLFTIARRRLVDHRRRGARRRTRPEPDSFFSDRSGSGDPGDPGALRLGRSSPDEALARLTAGLPREQAEIVALRVLGDLSIAEIAEILGKRPGAVRVAQHRALRRLASTLTADQVREAFDA